ncbi:MAG: HAD hydrolase-like protein [Acetobacter papayae]|uniref:HAD family hydrolase n=1 Tax=Acetobacter papayae TaxID=1076592 RepID=UPI0039E9E135
MICFDFDGVISDSLHMWGGVLHKTAARFGIDLPDDVRPFQRLRPLTFETLGKALGVDPVAFSDAMAAEAASNAAIPPLVQGMRGVLNSLAGQEPLVIVSSSRRAVIERFLVEHDLSHAFSDVIGSDVYPTKVEVLRTLLPAGARIMVGDAASDMEAARAVGIEAIGVLWGWQDADMLVDAHQLVQTPADLLDVLRASEGLSLHSH